MQKKQEKSSDDSKLKEKALQGAAFEVISRYGSAVKEHIVSYNGIDNENKKVLKKSLKSISKYKVNSNCEYSNIKQQAGFSAEVKSVARENAESIIEGKPANATRTDDIITSKDDSGRDVGGVNDELVDVVQLSSEGVPIAKSEIQLKFVGGDAKECAEKLLSRKYDKYRENKVNIEIPKDFYEVVNKEYDDKIKNLPEDIKKLEKEGKYEEANKKRKELKKVSETKELIKGSTLTNKEAIIARKHPLWSTTKDIAGIANRAGLQQAKNGALISGSISFIKNTVAYVKGEKDLKNSAFDTLKDTGTGAAFSYVTAYSGAMVKGMMQNSSSQYVRSLSNTNLASGLVSTTLNIGKTMNKLICGEITETECFEQLGEQGFGEICAAMYSTVAVAMVKETNSFIIKAVCGMAGSTLGYLAATAVYKELLTALKEYDLAHDDRIKIERECREAVDLICQYREEMNFAVEKYFSEHITEFNDGFISMDNAILENDGDGFIAGNIRIQKYLGHEIQFTNQR